MPRYPFSPELLDALPEELAELFRSLEIKLLKDICSRLKLGGPLNEVTVQNIRALRAHGIDLKAIKEAIVENSGIGLDIIESLLNEVVAKNQAYYTETIDAAQLTAPQRLIAHEDIWAIHGQTRGQYRNITQSMGFMVRQGRHKVMLPPANAYQWALDNAEMKVQSGAVSYDQAIAEAVRELAASGLKTVSYESGHIDSVDVAVRRAVMTGINQLNQKYREQSMEYLETDLVEVTAHSGARDIDGPMGWENHKKWQGKVYRWRDKPRASKGDYPDFEDTCGYGSVTGIGGANCKHSYWPFIEGFSERTYTDEELEDIDPPPFEFEGRTYTAYQATQKQREIERTIRKQKRLKAAYKAAGLTDEANAAGVKLRRLNQKYREFCKAAGLPEEWERARMGFVDEASEKKAAEKVEKRTESGIIEQNRSREIPEVNGTTEKAVLRDVTEEYLTSATPNSHIVQELHTYTINGSTYTVDGHNVVLDYTPHEKEIAELLERKIGGELFMVPRVNSPQGVSTPDYLFHGKGYDLKTIGKDAGLKTIWNRIKKAKRQARNFVIDVTNAERLTEDLIDRQIEKIYKDKETLFVEEMIVIRDNDILKIVKRA